MPPIKRIPLHLTAAQFFRGSEVVPAQPSVWHAEDEEALVSRFQAQSRQVRRGLSGDLHKVGRSVTCGNLLSPQDGPWLSTSDAWPALLTHGHSLPLQVH